MAMFVHLTIEKETKSILRAGIKISKNLKGVPHEGVFAMPVTPNFYISHQWLRELRRRGFPKIEGVYFRIPDAEKVWIGHYNDDHVAIRASEATARIMNSPTQEGWEVVIPRQIHRNEIHQVRHLPQIVGWRYQPNSHKKSYCGCIICTGQGTIRGRIKNQVWEAKQRRAVEALETLID